MSDSKIEVVCNYCKRSSIVALDAKVSKCGNCGAYTELDLTAYIGDEGKKVEQPVKKYYHAVVATVLVEKMVGRHTNTSNFTNSYVVDEHPLTINWTKHDIPAQAILSYDEIDKDVFENSTFKKIRTQVVKSEKVH